LETTAFVYWARAVPRIAQLKGRGTRFAPSDIIALGVLAIAVKDLGCSIGSLKPIVDDLFNALQDVATEQLRHSVVVFDTRAISVERLPQTADAVAARGFVPLEPLVMLFHSPEPSRQYVLPL